MTVELKAKTLTVQELIDELSCHDPEALVLFSYNYGDYWRTSVAQGINSIEEQEVRWSEYHRMHKLVDEDSEDEKNPTAIILS